MESLFSSFQRLASSVVSVRSPLRWWWLVRHSIWFRWLWLRSILSIIIAREYFIVQSLVSSWDSRVVVVPVSVQLVRIKVRRELRSMGRVGRHIRRGNVVYGRGPAVRWRRRGNHSKRPMEAWKRLQRWTNLGCRIGMQSQSKGHLWFMADFI